MSWNHFTEEEFSCNCGCGVNEIKSELIDRLETVRKIYGKPMRINSGHRCKVSNDKAGSSDTSSHLLGKLLIFHAPTLKTGTHYFVH